MAGAGPHCSICAHPQRHAIDKAILGLTLSNRLIASQYGVGYNAVQRHKQAGHVAQALIAYDAEKKRFHVDTAQIFELNVVRLGKAQDAADRWLTDPEDPEHYFLGARAEEVIVLYEETEPDENARSGFRTVRRKAKLHVLLDEVRERHGVRVTGFESKYADPRRLLVDYSEGLRSELTLFLQSLYKAEENADRKKQAGQSTADQEERMRVLFAGLPLEAMLAASFQRRLGVTAEDAARAGAEHADDLRDAMIDWFRSQG